MKKYIVIDEEALVRLVNGERIEGSLHRDEWTGVISFTAWKRHAPKKHKDKLIIQLENGWLKESPKRIKFFNSVNKKLDVVAIDHAMKRELKTAMRAFLGDQLVELLKEEEKEVIYKEIKTTGQLFLEGEGIE